MLSQLLWRMWFWVSCGGLPTTILAIAIGAKSTALSVYGGFCVIGILHGCYRMVLCRESPVRPRASDS